MQPTLPVDFSGTIFLVRVVNLISAEGGDRVQALQTCAAASRQGHPRVFLLIPLMIVFFVLPMSFLRNPIAH